MTAPERQFGMTNCNTKPVSEEYIRILARQRLPVQEPEIYGGDPVMFWPWKRAFDSLVQSACVSTAEKLSFLGKYTTGTTKTLVDRFRLRNVDNVERAYKEAWEELESRFGNPAVISSIIIKQLSTFSKIKADDNQRLLELADLCVDAVAHMKDLPHLIILDTPHGMNPVVEKLPSYVLNRWRERVATYKQINKKFPTFQYFTEFLTTVAKTQNDPDVPRFNNTQIRPDKGKASQQHRTRVFSTNTKDDTKQCAYHESPSHDLTECKAFMRKPIGERLELCRKKGLCFRCTQTHLAKDCTAEIICTTCQSKRHITCLHSSPAEKPQTTNKTDTNQEVTTRCTRLSKCSAGRSCSKIILAKVTKGENRKGRRGVDIIIESCDGQKRYPLPVVLENNDLPSDKGEIPTPDVCRAFDHLKPITNKIPEIREDIGIELLVGRNCPEILKVRENRNGPVGAPWAQRTDLEWTVSGELCLETARGTIRASVHRTTANCDVTSYNTNQCTRERFQCHNHIYAKDIIVPKPDRNTDIFEETARDENKSLSVEDKQFLDIMDKHSHVNTQGNLELPLTFKQEPEQLPNNYQSVFNRFNNLRNQFRRNPDLLNQYVQYMQKLIKREHASPVPTTELNAKNTWYLPHFAVQHPQKSQIRVVFDSSSKFNGISRNDVLLQGPDQLNSLLGILLRFRCNQIGIMGDVEQMFHNFHVCQVHRDYMRFLWFQDNNPTKPVIQYRMNVHIFGNVSSPAIATYGLRKIAHENRLTYGDDVSEFIHKDFYVDDGLTSQPDIATAISIIQRTREMLATRNINFHKIASNDRRVMHAMPSDIRIKDLQLFNLNRDMLPTQRSLGIQWSLQGDTFTFKVDLKVKPFSRRGVLATVNSVFDPLGILAPITLEGKLILRELLKDETNVCWDNPLSEKYLPRWDRWCSSLTSVERVHLNRCYTSPDFGLVKKRECHVFSDASDIAIGDVAYLRSMNHENKVDVAFLLGKAKLNPTHAVSVPRLELCAAVLATQLVQVITTEMQDDIDKVIYHTDSTIVLGYLQNNSKRFQVYVANRVQKMHSCSSPVQWRHVPSTQNPADLASRSVPAQKLTSTMWLQGPSFLWQPDYAPERELSDADQYKFELREDDPEVRKQPGAFSISVSQSKLIRQNKQDHLGSERFSRFSKWSSLRRAVANLINLAIANKRNVHGEKNTPHQVTSDILIQAENVILRTLQKEHFPEEYSILSSSNNRTLTKKSSLHQLSPFIDRDGLIRVGGRIGQANFDFGERHPILSPKDSHVSRLILEHVHQQIQHQGRQFTMGAVRSKGYWVPGLHNMVRNVINQCTVCKRLRAKPLTQIMADLPTDRLEATPPFTNVGIDVFGPWNVAVRKTRSGVVGAKRWGVIFVCLYTTAIHIEVIESMDTSAFINALRRFIAIRGAVKRLRCDNGTNFVGAKNELETAMKELNHGHIQKFLAKQACEWIFNPPHASHFGGIWERQIGTVRRILNAMYVQL
ncbi:uncharacterized protein LOC102809487, partial [Saccoglossus kowalevskii]|uniref:Uncharacterized protein LOC102809487 n=1 Tax=Saccoglossus kowalevskii TaxID=10224 RepID=A0ABM0MCC8_SACKO